MILGRFHQVLFSCKKESSKMYDTVKTWINIECIQNILRSAEPWDIISISKILLSFNCPTGLSRCYLVSSLNCFHCVRKYWSSREIISLHRQIFTILEKPGRGPGEGVRCFMAYVTLFNYVFFSMREKNYQFVTPIPRSKMEESAPPPVRFSSP